MDIKKYREAYENNPTNENRVKLNFVIAKRNNRVDTFRKQEIARRVALKYSLDEQISIILSGNTENITLLKSYRDMISAEVDHYIKQLESEVK